MDLVHKQNPNYVFLDETHCGYEGLVGLKAQLGICGLISIDNLGKSRGLGLSWNLTSGVIILG